MQDNPDEQAKKQPSLASTDTQTTSSNTEREKPVLPSDAAASSDTASGVHSVDDTEPVHQHNHEKILPFALGALVVMALGFGGGWLGANSRHDSATSVSQQRVVLKNQGDVISDIARNVGQSVVSVNVTGQAAPANPYASLFGLGGGTQTQQSAGTGIILTSDGLIMTNRHVVPAGTTSVSITLSDGTVYSAVKVLGRTNDTDSLDVAFLKIQDTKGKSLVAATIGNSAKVKVGDTVVAIGNALGQFQNTVTSGIISGYGRSVQASASDGSSSENLDDLFQTDAAINEGNSGGPLVNLDGSVIGMNTAVASNSQSIGFAIPINDLSGLIDSVKATGKLQRPYMGVLYVPITGDVKQQYSLPVSDGAYVPTAEQAGQETVLSGGPAAKAGVQPGDIITKIDGKAINQTTSVISLLDKHKVGDSVEVTIRRSNDTKTILVVLGSAPAGN